MADVDPVTTDTTPVADAEPDLSLSEHEAQYGTPGQRPEPDPEPEPDENPRRPPRDAGTGQFTKAPKEPLPARQTRSERQKAGPADVPRIAELTRKLREAEAERDTLKARIAPQLAPTPTPQPVQPRPAAVTAPPVAAPPSKPTLEQFNNYEAWMEALADWKIGELRRQDQAQRQQEAQQAQQRAEAEKLVTSWKERTDAARAKYPDFEAIALQAPTTIPQGSLVDHWILEHKAGAELLYEFQKDSVNGGHLLRDVLALPLLEQVEHLALLAQRLSTNGRGPAVDTGAVARPPVAVAPRPPTPVRTSAVQAPDEPPDSDHSVREHEKYWGPRH